MMQRICESVAMTAACVFFIACVGLLVIGCTGGLKMPGTSRAADNWSSIVNPAAFDDAVGSTALAVMQTKCAACHQWGMPEADQQEFVFLNDGGSLWPLSSDEKANMSRRIKAGTMPPVQNMLGVEPLDAAELKALLEFLK